ncbi:exported hypothetical protein [Candidatus Sulfopaludibacter sp. SbA4]|nr:exported hypothetical protein [Candidatus Sulfopaludibacter sp. SbA4]
MKKPPSPTTRKSPGPRKPSRAAILFPVFLLSLLPGFSPPARAQFTQQGDKLVGADASGTQPPSLGSLSSAAGAGAISADGNTAVVGRPWDGFVTSGSAPGALLVFTRTNGAWTQQGPKLVVTSDGNQFGFSVAISADGNTVIAGVPLDAFTGAVVVFTRTNGAWSQQGGKLLPSDATIDPHGNAVEFGSSVALSADGNTALVGGPVDNDSRGAVWVFVRADGVWSQQGNKLVGTGAATSSLGVGAHQGGSVALSADGNTALVGGSADNFDLGTHESTGAVWVFTRSNGVWSQQGNKLVGTGAAPVPGGAPAGGGGRAIPSRFLPTGIRPSSEEEPTRDCPRNSALSTEV